MLREKKKVQSLTIHVEEERRLLPSLDRSQRTEEAPVATLGIGKPELGAFLVREVELVVPHHVVAKNRNIKSITYYKHLNYENLC